MINFESSIRNVSKEAFQYFLNKSFDIRIGEYRRVLLMQLNIFLIISTLLIIKPIVTSLFLSTFGFQYLPTAFIVVAIIAIGVSSIFSRLLSKYSFQKIMTRTLLASVITMFLFGVLLRLNVMVQLILFLFYVWVSIFAVVSSSQFWVLANIIFNAREAKRVFGFIGAGAIAGGIFGGYLTSLFAQVLGSENLIFLSMLVLLPTIWITKRVWGEKSGTEQRAHQQKIHEVAQTENAWQMIRKSRHLTFMAGIIGISVIVAKLVDYQFNAIASLNISDPDKLTSFFGFWFSNFNLLSLFIQLFITRRVVGVFGVGTSLLFLPGAILIGAFATLFFPLLGAAIFIKLSDGSLKQSINKSATELLALPIPIEIKNKTKSFIDVFIDSAATGIGGLILIFLVNGMNLSTNFISLMIIVLLFVWGYFVLQVRKEYIKSFKMKISSQSSNKKQNQISISEESIIGSLIQQLNSGTDKQILYVLQKIREVPKNIFFSSLKQLLMHHSPEIRAKAIDNLRSYINHNLSGDMLVLINDNDQQVRVSAFEYLLALAPGNRIELIEQYLYNNDEKLNEAALIALARETKDNPELQNWFSVGQRIRERISQIETAIDESEKINRHIFVLKVIGLSDMPDYYHFITESFCHKNKEVVVSAIEAASETGHPHFIKSLSSYINSPGLSVAAQLALSRFGGQVLIEFMDMISREELPVELVRKTPTIAEKIDSQKSVDFIFFLLDYEDYQVHMECFKSFVGIKQNFPHLFFDKKLIFERIAEEAHLHQNSLLFLKSKFGSAKTQESASDPVLDARKSLIELIERRLEGSLDRIFYLLELRYPAEGLLSVKKEIQSDIDDVRMNAIEFLDNLLDPKLKKVLIPILETTIHIQTEENSFAIFADKEPTEFECYQMLLKGIDVKLKLAIFFLLEKKADPKFELLIKPYLNNNNVKIKTFAEKAILAIQQSISTN